MSLSVPIGTRSAPSSAPPPLICPRINVLFTLDRMSLLAIIDGMKGLNCSPLFGSHGGLKKGSTLTLAINGFFGPVTSSSSRLIPFILKAAGAFRSGVCSCLPYTVASAVYFLPANFTRGGCPLAIRVPLDYLLSVIRRLILLCSFFQRRPTAGPGSAGFLVLPCRPLIIR